MRSSAALSFFLLIFAVLPQSEAAGPYCHSCEVIINDVKAQFKNNFKYVTPQQLEIALVNECDKEFGGAADEHCRSIATANVNLILYELQQGHNAYYVCMTIVPPLC